MNYETMNTKLCYIYISEYKGIKEQEFSFTGEYDIRFDELKSILTIEKNYNHIDNFFANNMKEITAIIGANGCGKTSLLEFIKDKLFYRIEESEYLRKEHPRSFNTCLEKRENYILIFKKDAKLNIYYNEELIKKEVIVKGLPPDKYNLNDYSKHDYANIEDLNRFKMVYYSNIYDYSKPNSEKIHTGWNNYDKFKNYLDVTTNYLVNNTKSYRVDEIKRQLFYFKNGYEFEFEYSDNLRIMVFRDIKKLIENIERNNMTKMNMSKFYRHLKKTFLELLEYEKQRIGLMTNKYIKSKLLN